MKVLRRWSRYVPIGSVLGRIEWGWCVGEEGEGGQHKVSGVYSMRGSSECNPSEEDADVRCALEQQLQGCHHWFPPRDR